jgi:hypothetical protein
VFISVQFMTRSMVFAILALCAANQVAGQQALPVCLRSPVDSTGWRKVAAEIAPVSLRLPSDVAEYRFRHETTFGPQGAHEPPPPKVQHFFSQERSHGLFVTLRVQRRPGPYARVSFFAADSTVCAADIDGHHATVIIFRSVKPSVRHNVFAQMDLNADSVLVLEGGGDSDDRQAQAIGVLWTLRFRRAQ